MLSRSAAVGVLPVVLRKELSSEIESRPMSAGAGLCDADGEWLDEMCRAAARP